MCSYAFFSSFPFGRIGGEIGNWNGKRNQKIFVMKWYDWWRLEFESRIFWIDGRISMVGVKCWAETHIWNFGHNGDDLKLFSCYAVSSYPDEWIRDLIMIHVHGTVRVEEWEDRKFGGQVRPRKAKGWFRFRETGLTFISRYLPCRLFSVAAVQGNKNEFWLDLREIGGRVGVWIITHVWKCQVGVLRDLTPISISCSSFFNS